MGSATLWQVIGAYLEAKFATSAARAGNSQQAASCHFNLVTMIKRQRMADHNMATPTPHKTALWVLLVIVAACHSAAQPRETNTCGIAVCFAIDKSGSIGTSNFPKTQQFIIDVIDGVSEVADGELIYPATAVSRIHQG